MSDYFICPHCGAHVEENAVACPECGSDDQTGWSEESRYDGLWLPDEPSKELEVRVIPWGRLGMTAVSTLILAAFLVTSFEGAIYLLPALFIAAAVLYYRIGRSADYTPPAREVELYESLLRRAQGDTDLLERLVDYERDRTPNARRRELLEAALRRWERDNL